MLEFMLFNDHLKDRFVDRIQRLGVVATVKADKVAGWVVMVREDIPEETLTAVEECYDHIMDEQEELAEKEEGWVERHLAGVDVTLSDGRRRTVRLDPHTASRLLEHFSPEEVQAIVEAIARGLEGDTDGPLCKGPVPL